MALLDCISAFMQTELSIVATHVEGPASYDELIGDDGGSDEEAAAIDQIVPHQEALSPSQTDLIRGQWAPLEKLLMTILNVFGGVKVWRDRTLFVVSDLIKLVAMMGIRDGVGATMSALAETAMPEFKLNTSNKSGTGSHLLINELNLAASKTVLQLGLALGESLETSWAQVVQVINGNDQFNVIKTRTEIPALPTSNASLTSASQSSKKESSSSLPLAASPTPADLDRMGDLAELSRMIIEKSSYLSPSAFCHLLEALGSLMVSVLKDSGVVGGLRNTLALLPAQKLKQIVLFNVDRFTTIPEGEGDRKIFDTTWEKLVEVLGLIFSVVDAPLRGLGCEFLTLLTTQIANKLSSTLKDAKFPEPLQLLIFTSLKNFNTTPYSDVHKTVQECLQRLVQHLGPMIDSPSAWHLIMDVVKSPCRSEERSLMIIRCAFVTAKTICADLLPVIDSSETHPSLVQVLVEFVQMPEELNISLTAIGLLWDIADHVRRLPDLPLWIEILRHLTELATDVRPEIRNSSIQTITRAVEIGGEALDDRRWDLVLENVLLRLMDQVRVPTMLPVIEDDTKNVPSEPMNTLNLTHHSRDTAEKQWDETQSLLLQGVSMVYLKYLHVLVKLEHFEPTYWSRLLDLFRKHCIEGKSQELVGISVQCLNNLVTYAGPDIVREEAENNGRRREKKKPKKGSAATRTDEPEELAKSLEETVVIEEVSMAVQKEPHTLWITLWQCWCDLSASMNETSLAYTQDTLLCFIRIFPALLRRYQMPPSLEWQRVSFGVLQRALQCPTPMDHIRDLDNMTELQKAVLETIDALLDYNGDYIASRSLLISTLADFLDWLKPRENLAMTRSSSGRRSRVPTSSGHSTTMDQTDVRRGVTFVALGVAAMERINSRISEWRDDKQLYPETIMKALKSLGRLVLLKYYCPTGSAPVAMWKIATQNLNSILLSTIGNGANSENNKIIWPLVVELVEEQFKMNMGQVPVELTVDQLDHDEEFDIGQVQFVRDKLLPLMAQEVVAEEALARIMMIFEECSHLYTLPEYDQASSPGLLEVRPVVKERLAISNLHSLFLICASHDDSADPVSSTLSRSRSNLAKINSCALGTTLPLRIRRVALPILLERCRGVLRRYCQDRSIYRKMPFPRIRQDEIIFILTNLNAITLPVDSSTPPSGESLRGRLICSPYGHLFYLYENLCECMRLEENTISVEVQRSFSLIGLSLGLISQ